MSAKTQPPTEPECISTSGQTVRRPRSRARALCSPGGGYLPATSSLSGESNKADEVMTLIDKAYHPDTYRGMYEDDRIRVLLPVQGELSVDKTMLPPRPVERTAGRPKKKGLTPPRG
ncbi:unnamed protein product [Pylaiella littoralis]